jgi:hypothetical protein
MNRRPPLSTGMPHMDARSDFTRARRAHLAARALRVLTARRGAGACPRTLDPAAAGSRLPARLQVVPLHAIVGTVDPAPGFDAKFRPASNRLASRWQRVALAHREHVPLPPVTLIQRPDGFYVVDGRHRVSVGRAMRQADIDAWVTPVLEPRRDGQDRQAA